MKHKPQIENYCFALVREMCDRKIDLAVAVEIVAKVFKLDEFDKEYIFVGA